MLPAAAISLLQDRLGNRTGLETKITAEMNFVQQNILERTEPFPWFLLKSAPLSTTAPIPASVAVPTDFLKEYEDCGLWLQNADGTETLLSKDEYEVLNSSDYIATLEGDSVGYSLLGETFYFFPKPLAPISVRIFYYAKVALPATASTETLWYKHAPDLLIAETGIQISRFLRDNTAIGLFDADRKRAYATLATQNESRKMAARRLAMGE